MKKWITVHGKRMDAVEFTRFIREQTAADVERHVTEMTRKQRRARQRLKRLQEAA